MNTASTNNKNERRYVKLRRTTETFEDAWNSLRYSNLAIGEMFPNIEYEKDFRIACLDLLDQHMPSYEFNEKIENYQWCLNIKRDSLLIRTDRNVSISYKIEFEFDDDYHVVGTTYNFSVTIGTKDNISKKLLINAGWVLDDEEVNQ